MKREIRCYEIEELRTEDGDSRKVSGYAAVFEKLSEDLGSWRPMREKIRAGAFRDSIANGDVRAFWNHNTDIVLGRNKNDSLKLWEDQHGLAFELNLPDTQAGRDAFVSIKRGDVSAMSFGFRVRKDEWARPQDQNEPIIRTLLDIELFEVSPVAFPAYPQTDVHARSLDEIVKAKLEEWEKEEQKPVENIQPFLARQRKLELTSRFLSSVYRSRK